jgi:hypothetical protein
MSDTREYWYYLSWDLAEAMEVTEPRPGEHPKAWQTRAPSWTPTCQKMSVADWKSYRKDALRELKRIIRRIEKKQEFIALPSTDTPWPSLKPKPQTPMTPLRRWIHRRFLTTI